MENEENKKEVKQGNDHPKPTDDVQLEIETVTPSTEKETIQPGESAKKSEETEDQVEKADTTEKPTEDSKNEGEDKRDDIETTTPSA